MPVADTG